MCLGVGSSADSIDFWTSTAVENIFLEATSETKKSVEQSIVLEKKALAEGGIEQVKEAEKNETVKDTSTGVGSFSPPSFSLGFTQDSPQSTQKSTVSQSSPEAAVGPNAVVCHAVPLSFVPGPLPSELKLKEEVGPSEPKGKGKREKKLTAALMSPFKDRLTNIKAALTHDEMIVSEWLFNLKGDIM